MNRESELGRLAGIGALIGFGLIAGLYLVSWMDWGWGHSIFASMCHQKAERCFAVGGTVLAVCARCLGIYAGLTFGCAVCWIGRVRVAGPWYLLGVAVGLNAGDFFLELSGLYGNAVWLRLGLGVVLGTAIPLFAFSRLGYGKS